MPNATISFGNSAITPLSPVAAHIANHAGVERIANPKIEMFIVEDFFPDVLCELLTTKIESERRPSTLADANGDYAFRTSETCDLASEDAVVVELKRRMIALTGLDPSCGEPMQGQRYEVGQEFKAHTDYFEPTSAEFVKYCGVSGQRTWTAMLYLNEVAAGGETHFKAVDRLITPKTGRLLIWNNLRPNGTPNPSTLHHARKVESGLKYVITQWFREKTWGWS